MGDIIRIEEDESFPCDMVLLSSSNDEGKCYITTANLDGETNYKVSKSSFLYMPLFSKKIWMNGIQVKLCPKLTRELTEPDLLDGLRAHMEYQQPTVNLYQFVGTLTVYPDDQDETVTTSLGLDNVLLRGCRLKDTDHVYGKVLKIHKYASCVEPSCILNRMCCVYGTRYKTWPQFGSDRHQVLDR